MTVRKSQHKSGVSADDKILDISISGQRNTKRGGDTMCDVDGEMSRDDSVPKVTRHASLTHVRQEITSVTEVTSQQKPEGSETDVVTRYVPSSPSYVPLSPVTQPSLIQLWERIEMDEGNDP